MAIQVVSKYGSGDDAAILIEFEDVDSDGIQHATSVDPESLDAPSPEDDGDLDEPLAMSGLEELA